MNFDSVKREKFPVHVGQSIVTVHKEQADSDITTTTHLDSDRTTTISINTYVRNDITPAHLGPKRHVYQLPPLQ